MTEAQVNMLIGGLLFLAGVMVSKWEESMNDYAKDLWTQRDEINHIRALGTHSKRAEDLATLRNPAEREVAQLSWRIKCLRGYLEAVGNKPRSRYFPGYDQAELKAVAWTALDAALLAAERIGVVP